MAGGKTTLGRAVAAMSRCDFVDLDEYIEHKTGMTVSEIFARHGETRFRQLEHSALKELVADPRPMIVACGGGTPCNPANMELINSHGVSVWLQTDIPRLVQRLRLTPGQRPLIDALRTEDLARYVADKLAERATYYSQAHERFDSSRLEDEDMIRRSAEQFIARFMQ